MTAVTSETRLVGSGLALLPRVNLLVADDGTTTTTPNLAAFLRPPPDGLLPLTAGD